MNHHLLMQQLSEQYRLQQAYALAQGEAASLAGLSQYQMNAIEAQRRAQEHFAPMMNPPPPPAAITLAKLRAACDKIEAFLKDHREQMREIRDEL